MEWCEEGKQIFQGLSKGYSQNIHLLIQVLEFLSNPSEESRHEEREQAFLELLNSGGLGDADEDKLLSLAEKAKL